MSDRQFNERLILFFMVLAVIFMIVFMVAVIATASPTTLRLRTSCDADKHALKSSYYREIFND